MKKVPIEENNDPSKVKIKNYIFYLLLVISLSISIIVCFLISLYIINLKKAINLLEVELIKKENKIKEDEIIIKRNSNKEKTKNKKSEKEEGQKNFLFEGKQYYYDNNFLSFYHMFSGKSKNKKGYEIILHTHHIEKGLSHFELRPFGKEPIKNLINCLKEYILYSNFENDFPFINGINSLKEYQKVYENNKWTDLPEYKEVSSFLDSFKYVKEQKTGAYITTYEELKKDFSIDYYKFLYSRHSIRNYKKMDLKEDDIRRAVEIAILTPSACNRQYIKVHFFSEESKKKNVIEFAIGKNGFYLDGVNTFLLTFDVNGLTGDGERNQGYFNAGLFATNFVNALHSLGIGTCYIQFSNPSEDEEKLKFMNKIPINERIAVILFAGYYDEKSIVTVSPRRDVNDVLKINN